MSVSLCVSHRLVIAAMTFAGGAVSLATPVAAREPVPQDFLSLCLASLPAANPQTIWTAWSFAPQIVLPVVIAIALYVRGRFLLASAKDPRCPTALEAGSFFLGMLMLGIAVLSPLCRMASTLAWAHMVQHAILVAIAPPLILLGRPKGSLAAALPALRLSPLRSSGLASRPLLAGMIYGAAIWLWHMPDFYQTALLDRGTHLLMYGSLLAVSLLFWQGVVETVRTPGEQSGLVAMSLLVTIIHTGLLGALLTFSQALWYPLVGARAGSWGMSPFEDQELAGLIMWVPMALIYLVAGLAVVGAWLNALTTDRTKLAEVQPDFGSSPRTNVTTR